MFGRVSGWMPAVLLLAAGRAWAQEPAAPTGPAAYWKLDETLGPSSANAVAGAPAGTWQNGPTPNVLVPSLSYNGDPGVTPRSLGFNGTNQGLRVADFGAFTSYTVSCFVRRTGSTAARESIVSYKESAGRGFVLCLNENGSSFYPRIWTNINNAWQNVEQAVAVPVDTWVHLAATYNGTVLRLIRDGVVTQTNFAGTMSNGAGTATAIGMRNSNDMHFFPGLVDDVRVYGRALGDSEIAVLAAGVPAPTGVVATGEVHQISLVWIAPPQGVTYTYRVLRRAAGSVDPFVILDPAVTGTSYVDTTAVGGTSWEYSVRAVSVAESGMSATSTATALTPAPRFDDHEEGLWNGNCSCGTAAPVLTWPWAVLAAALLLAWRRRA